MKKNTIAVAALLATGLGSGLAYPAFAEGNGQNDQAEAQAVLSAKVSLAGAISAAEASGAGKAVEAKFDTAGDTVEYEITVLAKDGSETNLFVDGATGNVAKVAMLAEKADDGDQNEGEDGSDNGDEGEDD